MSSSNFAMNEPCISRLLDAVRVRHNAISEMMYFSIISPHYINQHLKSALSFVGHKPYTHYVYLILIYVNKRNHYGMNISKIRSGYWIFQKYYMIERAVWSCLGIYRAVSLCNKIYQFVSDSCDHVNTRIRTCAYIFIGISFLNREIIWNNRLRLFWWIQFNITIAFKK